MELAGLNLYIMVRVGCLSGPVVWYAAVGVVKMEEVCCSRPKTALAYNYATEAAQLWALVHYCSDCVHLPA
jgi:hypothetical protein